MKDEIIRPTFKSKIKIEGSVLFLMGPIGSFFSRLSSYLAKKEIKTYKISFPLYEFGFSKSKRIYFNKDILSFKEFLKQVILKKEIKHIFMYGNVLIPHRQALDLSQELQKEGIKINTHIFELGYLRPNFVTLESDGINFTSSLILNKDFYMQQEGYKKLPTVAKHGLRIRKFWKLITFINHCFQNYKIVEFEHKLQPKPHFLWFQIKGFLLKYYFQLSEYKLKKKYFNINSFFITILQVSTDSQLTKGSNFKNNYEFIEYVIKNFSNSNIKNVNLIFKHHPRDRGYINYSDHIKLISKKFNIEKKVFYFHDCFLSNIFSNPNCKGTVLINSTVGYQSLFHSVPVKSLGVAPYNIEGLSDQKSLTSFFRNPSKVDKSLFLKFYRYIIENSQINGNFDEKFPFSDVFII